MKLKLPIGAPVSPYKQKGVRELEIHKRDGGFYLMQFDGATTVAKASVYFADLKSAMQEAARVWGVKSGQWESL
jgi:hypothetical protein